MKRTIRFYISAALFLLFTAVKLIAPAAAAGVHDAILPVLDRDDDFSAILDTFSSKPIEVSGEPYVAVPPMEQTRAFLDSLHQNYFADLPAAQGPIPTPTPTPDPRVTAGEAVKAAFLESQSAYSAYPQPENVRYDVVSLPFAETSPVAASTSSGFGYRLHPIDGVVKFHYGTDFAANTGMDILAFADGTVLAVGEDDGYGKYVKLDHGSGYVTLYGHCSELLVKAGETVSRGQPIARVGQTGHATGPHLHFELLHDGVYLNPEFYLAA